MTGIVAVLLSPKYYKSHIEGASQHNFSLCPILPLSSSLLEVDFQSTSQENPDTGFCLRVSFPGIQIYKNIFINIGIKMMQILATHKDIYVYTK